MARTKQCPECGKTIEYRSKLCWDCHWAQKNRACVDCGQKINGKYDRCWTCHAKRIEVTARYCVDCGKELPRYGKGVRCNDCKNKQIAQNAHKWVCIDCGVDVGRRVKRCPKCNKVRQSVIGKYQRTEETLRKMSQSQKNREVPWRTGKPHKPETREKMKAFWTNEKRAEAAQRWEGNGNPGYIHGEHPRPWPPEFSAGLRTSIKKRDGYICQLCYQHLSPRSRMIDIHHIDYNKQNCEPINLITLCRSCHAKTNFNRSDWRIHFESLQAQRARNGFLPRSDHHGESTNQVS